MQVHVETCMSLTVVVMIGIRKGQAGAPRGGGAASISTLGVMETCGACTEVTAYLHETGETSED